MKNVKKLIPILFLTFLLSACADSAPAPSETSPSPSEDQTIEASDVLSADLTQETLDRLRLNVGQSNYDNSVNLKGQNPGKVCYVPETDTLFYSDNGGTYQKNGESVIKLLDEPIFSINVADGKLYFIRPTGEDRVGSYGDLYRMDLSSGAIDRVLEEEVANASVYKDAIFYSKRNVIDLGDGLHGVGISCFRSDLDGSNGEKASALSFGDDLCVFQADDMIRATDLSKNETVELAEEAEMTLRLSVYRGCVYYIRNTGGTADTAIRIDLTDGSVTEWRAKDAYFEDYGFVDDKLCLYNLGSCFYLTEGEELIKYDCPQSYRDIYTCNNKIYALKPGGKLCELQFGENHGYYSVSELEIKE
ncbi:MAG: DUF5050 domain-containing protein [Bacteroides sp.]|nr:DUF5050 domain-containing protein [Eubacterium sp.]MCM1418726.1 DUF5050 domain-containing protein [Roseburia sp.]MCM1462793.1 DUF5050 domain-containing protein [Bacteroides sp.]